MPLWIDKTPYCPASILLIHSKHYLHDMNFINTCFFNSNGFNKLCVTLYDPASISNSKSKSDSLLTRLSPSNSRPLFGIFWKLEIFLTAFALPGPSAYSGYLWGVWYPCLSQLIVECTFRERTMCWVGPCFQKSP